MTIPIFPLGPETTSNDLTDAIEASVQYQSEHAGKFGPIFAFAPMVEPPDLDRWVPVKGTPENLLVISVERSADAKLRKVIEKAGIGPLYSDSAESPVQFSWEAPLAELFAQMEEAGFVSYCWSSGAGADDASFYCIRGQDAIVAFNKALIADIRLRLGRVG